LATSSLLSVIGTVLTQPLSLCFESVCGIRDSEKTLFGPVLTQPLSLCRVSL